MVPPSSHTSPGEPLWHRFSSDVWKWNVCQSKGTFQTLQRMGVFSHTKLSDSRIWIIVYSPNDSDVLMSHLQGSGSKLQLESPCDLFTEAPVFRWFEGYHWYPHEMSHWWLPFGRWEQMSAYTDQVLTADERDNFPPARASEPMTYWSVSEELL